MHAWSNVHAISMCSMYEVLCRTHEMDTHFKLLHNIRTSLFSSTLELQPYLSTRSLRMGRWPLAAACHSASFPLYICTPHKYINYYTLKGRVMYVKCMSNTYIIAEKSQKSVRQQNKVQLKVLGSKYNAHTAPESP